MANNFLYADLTYKIRGAVFAVRKEFGSGFKEIIYQKALAKQLEYLNINFVREPNIPIFFLGEEVGVYKPDFLVEDKIIIEIKSTPQLLWRDEKQLWYYLKGTEHKIALLVNLGSPKLEIKRWIYDKAREKYKRQS